MRSIGNSRRSGCCRTLATAGVVAGLAVLAGCDSQHWGHHRLDRLDRVWVGAGDTQARNMRIQAVDPIPDPERRPRPHFDGRRILAVMNGYRGPEAGPAEAAPGGVIAEPGADVEGGL